MLDTSAFVRKLIADQVREDDAHAEPTDSPMAAADAATVPPSPQPVPASGEKTDGWTRPALVPPSVTCVEDTGLESGFIMDLILKIVYFRGVITGGDIAGVLRLPFSGVVEYLIEAAKQGRFIEVQGSSNLLSNSYKYSLSDKGHQKVQELLERSTYAGACPVILDDYTYMVGKQRARDAKVTRSVVEERFSQMVLAPRVLEQLGPAINSGESIFVFGAPGNGKTTIAEIATTCLGGDVYIPYALYVEGEIIRVFDESIHQPIEEVEPDVDERWVRCKRPTVIAGGELTLSMLDLTYSRESKTYEAPLQMKANCGMFLIDDFGRQQCAPAALLNRWIVPLEKHVDYLNLVTGIKIKTPFEELIVFSTNLSPRDLVDDAFLRRLQYKIEVLPPAPDQFREIFRRVAAGKGVEWNEETFDYLMEEHYGKAGRQPQACHPRDLLNQLLSMSRYYDIPALMSRDLIDRAVRSYFVRLSLPDAPASAEQDGAPAA
ncbi:MAG TPA: ATP-binding protein [Chloroflexota bacterium]|nr:ATP-binding protein [Chloroflexota bacterium]